MKTDPFWCERSENRLFEMFRGEHTLEEMARELSLPIDVIEKKLRVFDQDFFDSPFKLPTR